MGGHFLLMALIWLINDRYALVLVPYAIAVLLAARPRLHRATAGAGLMIALIVTIAGIRDHLSYNRALWAAVDTLHQSGVPARDINGGYVVNGWLQYVHPEACVPQCAGNIEIPWVNGDNFVRTKYPTACLRDRTCCRPSAMSGGSDLRVTSMY